MFESQICLSEAKAEASEFNDQWYLEAKPEPDCLLEFEEAPIQFRKPKSIYRVSVNSMNLTQLETLLQHKVAEKLGKDVPVTLVDKHHAKCGLCASIISINKKFEVVHVVRHFNAWHPAAHKCPGEWPLVHELSTLKQRPISNMDFAVVDFRVGASNNLQCLWCGVFLSQKSLAAHFHQNHSKEVEVPSCSLCVTELVVNARLTEKFGEYFNVTLVDQIHLRWPMVDYTFGNEAQLDIAITKYLHELTYSNGDSAGEIIDGEEMPNEAHVFMEKKGLPSASSTVFSNSRMAYGSLSKPKRHFIKPSLRQAIPADSTLVEEIEDSHLKCKLCSADIYAAVISAGAIKHFKESHPEELHDLQFELCKARLDRISDKGMIMLNENEIECIPCKITFQLHHPFNMCRAIQHLKAKHPSNMPEYQVE